MGKAATTYVGTRSCRSILAVVERHSQSLAGISRTGTGLSPGPLAAPAGSYSPDDHNAGTVGGFNDCDAVLSGHYRSLLAQFGLTPKSTHGLAARELGEAAIGDVASERWKPHSIGADCQRINR